LQEVLERQTEKSALLLRKLLGKIRLEPVKPDVGRPYLRARSQLQTLALLEIEPDAKEGERGLTAPDAGSTSLRWWRRGESNPRPKILYSGPLRAFPVIWVSSPGTPAGKVPFGPSREKARPSAPREEASGYPVRVTSSRLYGHSTVGGRRLKPPELTDSRWRLLVSRFLRGAGPRHATHEHRHPRRSRFAPL